MWRFLRNRRLILRLHTIIRALIYWAHRAVIFAIAWLLVTLSGGIFDLQNGNFRWPWLDSRGQQKVYCCPCRVGQATCSEDDLENGNRLQLGSGRRPSDRSMWHRKAKPADPLYRPNCSIMSDDLALTVCYVQVRQYSTSPWSTQ